MFEEKLLRVILDILDNGYSSHKVDQVPIFVKMQVVPTLMSSVAISPF